jgi:hypothetical protein
MPDKERERRYITLLRSCLEMPPGESAEGETPDFVLGEAPARIGVEITEYHHHANEGSPPFQEVQSLKWRIVERAERIYSEWGGPALYLTAIFGPHGRLTKRAVPGIAQRLAEAVLAVRVPSSAGQAPVEIPWDLLPDEIAKAWAHGSVDGVDRLWKPDHMGWVVAVSPEHVQAVLNRKERMVAAARRRCDTLWLVLVHNLARGAPCELSEEAASANYTSGFDRVLWMDPHGPHTRDLRVSAG